MIVQNNYYASPLIHFKHFIYIKNINIQETCHSFSSFQIGLTGGTIYLVLQYSSKAVLFISSTLCLAGIHKRQTNHRLCDCYKCA